MARVRDHHRREPAPAADQLTAPQAKHSCRPCRASRGSIMGGHQLRGLASGGRGVRRPLWDYALSYCEYVSDRLARVADRPEVAGEAELLDFDTWLTATDRHGELMSRHRGRRNRMRLRRALA